MMRSATIINFPKPYISRDEESDFVDASETYVTPDSLTDSPKKKPDLSCLWESVAVSTLMAGIGILGYASYNVWQHISDAVNDASPSSAPRPTHQAIHSPGGYFALPRMPG